MTPQYNSEAPNAIALNVGEEIIWASHPHFMTILQSLILLLFVFCVPFFLLWPLFRLGNFGIVVFILLVATSLILAFREFRRWSKTKCFLTTERCIYVVQTALLAHSVFEVPYRNILEISYNISGFWPTLMRYGTIRIQTAGSPEALLILNIPRAESVYRKILEYRDYEKPKTS